MDREELIATLVAIFLVLFGLNFIAVWLWGILAVGIFGLPALSYWQMFGLRVLLGIILPGVKYSGGDN